MELRIPVPVKIAHTPTIPISPNTLASRNAQRKLEEQGFLEHHHKLQE